MTGACCEYVVQRLRALEEENRRLRRQMEEPQRPRPSKDVLNKRIDGPDCPLSARAQRVMTILGVVYLGDLARLTWRDVLRPRNVGRKTLRELEDLLRENGLAFGTKLETWEPPA